MSFQIATVDDPKSPSLASNFTPIRLGGPTGIIARFVNESGIASETPWALHGEHIIKLSGKSNGCDLVFFSPGGDSAPDGSIEIYRLESLNGVAAADRTDIVCFFSPLRMCEAASGTWNLSPPSGQRLCESLSLSGGTKGGRWLWTQAPMTLGATIVGATAGCSGGCSSEPSPGECCGNCH